jgi:Ca-activated chloride channel family protein
MGQDDSVLVKTPISVMAVSATLSGPSEGRAGSTIEVPWSGPDNSGDYIGIGKIGVNESLQYAYTSNGNPAYLTLPTKAGSYELRYYMGQDNHILTKTTITITAATATLSAADRGTAGTSIEVEWSGPDDSGDYIGICQSGTNESLEYTYTSYGNPVHVTLPTKPGAYEIKYFVGQDNSVLVSIPMVVTED